MRRQQWICRIAFVLGGLLPLLVLCAALVVRHSVGSVARWRGTLQAQLGMQVEIEEIDFPRPGVVRFRGLTLMHPETHQMALRCDTVQMTHNSHGVAFTVPRVTFQTANWGGVRRILFDRLLKQPELLRASAHVSIEDFVFTGAAPQNHATNMEIALMRRAEGTEATIEFRWKGQPETDRVFLHLLRRSPTANIPTRIEVSTGHLPLPCHLIVGIGEQPSARLAELTFQGDLWIEPLDSGWNAEFHGIIAPIDLNAWVGQPFGTTWTGQARAVVREAKVVNGTIDVLVGTLHCDQGVIAGDLLSSAERHLQLQIDWPTDAASQARRNDDERTESPWEYQQLALHVQLDSAGLLLRAMHQLGTAAPGTIMLLPADGLCRVPHADAPPLSPALLLQTLSPTTSHSVPLHDELKPFLSVLPLQNHHR